MILDSEIQRKLLLGLIHAATFRGEAIDALYTLKATISEASLERAAPPREPVSIEMPCTSPRDA